MNGSTKQVRELQELLKEIPDRLIFLAQLSVDSENRILLQSTPREDLPGQLRRLSLQFPSSHNKGRRSTFLASCYAVEELADCRRRKIRLKRPYGKYM